MKILNKVGSWIDKLDTKIFGKEGYQPLAGQGFIMALKVAIGVGIMVFVVQMFTTGRTAENWAAAIGGLIILGGMVMKTLPNFKGAELSTGAKIGYGFFCFFLAYIALMLAMWIVFLLIIILVVHIVLFFVGDNSSSGSKSGKVTRDDCYHCELKGHGRRVCRKLSGYEGKEVICDTYNPADCPHYTSR